jgi:hypothetical protein
VIVLQARGDNATPLATWHKKWIRDGSFLQVVASPFFVPGRHGRQHVRGVVRERTSGIDAVITAEHAFHICVMHGVHDGGVFG